MKDTDALEARVQELERVVAGLVKVVTMTAEFMASATTRDLELHKLQGEVNTELARGLEQVRGAVEASSKPVVVMASKRGVH